MHEIEFSEFAVVFLGFGGGGGVEVMISEQVLQL